MRLRFPVGALATLLAAALPTESASALQAERGAAEADVGCAGIAAG
jgi:hypothetical protein